MFFHEMHPITALNGAIVEHWSGVEMALGGGNDVLDEDGCQDGVLRTLPVIWYHSSVPFSQFTHIDLLLEDGQNLRIIAEAKCAANPYGLFFLKIQSQNSDDPPSEHSIYRKHESADLPKGKIHVEVLQEDNSLSVIDVVLYINQTAVRLVAGEVYERDDRFEVVLGDESVLLQVDGQRPNWAFNRTNCGWLRQPQFAG